MLIIKMQSKNFGDGKFLPQQILASVIGYHLHFMPLIEKITNYFARTNGVARALSGNSVNNFYVGRHIAPVKFFSKLSYDVPMSRRIAVEKRQISASLYQTN